MLTGNYLLSFSTDVSGEQLFIHADAAGLDHLVQSLCRLRAKLAEGISDHDHLMSEAWGSDELTPPLLAAGERTVQHVKVWAWTPEKTTEHRLKA